jgi:DnaJ family protein A protein 5
LEPEIVEEFYCPICDKTFKSENALKNHLKSKAHLKKMKKLLAEVTMESEKHLLDDVQGKIDDFKQDGE